MMRTCKKCGVTQPLTAFRESKPGYRRWTCSNCMDHAAVKWQQENQQKVLAWRRQYYDANRKKEVADTKQWNAANREAHEANKRRHYNRLKAEAIAAYGGPVCACCGEDEPIFMTIDHVHNDQGEYAKRLGRPHVGMFLWKWLKDHNYPKNDFQILCQNCNQGKRINGGVCPHQVKKV